jgi:hypothetical protein
VPARDGGGGRPRRRRGRRGGYVAGPGPAGRGPGGRGGAHGREGVGAVVAGERPEHAATGWGMGINQSASAGRVKSGSDSLRALFIVGFSSFLLPCLPGWGFASPTSPFPLGVPPFNRDYFMA